jgi:hypothetical protein
MSSPRLTEPVLHRGEGQCLGNGTNEELDRIAIREQLDRILASSVFRNSRRNSSLLRHVVERTLEGKPDELKERSIGVDVFGKAANYDTNTDHVVRSVAGEVRRRLAQYYMEAGRETELRIDLQAGSYVPQFRLPAERPVLPQAFPQAEAVFPADAVSAGWFGRWLQRRWLMAAARSLLLLALASATVLRFATRPTAIESFWNPFFSSPNPAMLCFGGGGTANPSYDANQTLAVGEFERQPFRRMHTSDAVALADLAGLLQVNRKPFRIVNRASSTSFRDLQSGPFILVGGMNNEWTLRLTSGLRFSFERQPNGAHIADKQNPANTAWAVDFTKPLAEFNRDYAIVSRVRDPKTEQTVVIVAGIASWGTLAAGEFVTMPEHLKKLEASAPKHWEQKNLQVVLATDVIRGSSGPPIVLAAHFW